MRNCWQSFVATRSWPSTVTRNLNAQLSLIEITTRIAKLAKLYPLSLYEGLRNRHRFEGLESFVLFIGCSRSGHSIVGSLLDAHPNALIAHEVGILLYVRAGFSRAQICALLNRNTVEFTRAGRESKGYNFQVPNQWQGRGSNLHVLGDKMAEGATRRLRSRPDLIMQLERTMKMPVKLIHVVRNPFDNISTLNRRSRKTELTSEVDHAAEFFFTLCETAQQIRRKENPGSVFELRHESLIDSPRLVLQNLCKFLGLEATDDYLDDSTSVIHSVPNRSREKTSWTPEMIDRISEQMARFEFLEGYSFTS